MFTDEPHTSAVRARGLRVRGLGSRSCGLAFGFGLRA